MDAPTALTWLDAERGNLLAAIPQAAAAVPALPHELPGELTRALYTFFELRGYWHDAIQANQTALRLARRTADRTAEAYIQSDLGSRYSQLGRDEEAIASLQDGLALFRQLGHGWGQARTLRFLGPVYGKVGRHAEAIACI